MNGDLLTTNIIIGGKDGNTGIEHGVFYSIIDPNEVNDTTGTNPAAQ